MSCAPANANSYPIDTTIVLTGTFVSVPADLAPVDPSAVNLYLQDPSGQVTELSYPAAIVRVSLGVYSYSFVPPKAGLWTYKWQGLGAVIATSFDRQFFVSASALLPA